MGYGGGRWWHRYRNFPNFPRVTKTLTYYAKIGLPFTVLKFGKSVWNRVGLHNIGFYEWCLKYKEQYKYDVIVSLHGTVEELSRMIHVITWKSNIKGIELNYSCPNVHIDLDYTLPIILKEVTIPIYLKLSYDMDPYKFDLNNIAGIRLNSVPFLGGGGSGNVAKEKNWAFIKKFNKEGLNVAGCSWYDSADLKQLKDFGCSEIGIGSTILLNPSLVEGLS